MSLHSFDPKIAEAVGVNAAVVYQNFMFWCQKNLANRKHIKDGYVWTYNSRRALAELFSYLSESQIRTALEKLVENGLLVKGEHNVAGYDRTMWYAPKVSSEWVSAIGEKSPMDRSKIANGLGENRQPIPDSNTDTKPDTSSDGLFPSQEIESTDDGFDAFWAIYPRKVGKKEASSRWSKVTKQTVPAVIMAKLESELPGMAKTDLKYIKHPASWLGAETWLDDEPVKCKRSTADQTVARLKDIALSIRVGAVGDITNDMARQCVEAGLITADKCREKGLLK